MSTMTNISATQLASNPVARKLGAVLLRRRSTICLTRLAQATWIWFVLVLLVVLLDALFPLGAVIRCIADLIFVLFAGFGIWLGVRARWSGLSVNRESLEEARRMEVWLGERFNTLVNALCLMPTQRDEGLAGVLAKRAVNRGSIMADRIDPNTVVDRKSLHRHSMGLGLVLALWLILLLVQPRLVGAVIPRLIDPLGDHPPFSTTIFEVSFEPKQIESGQDVIVKAQLSGVLPQNLDMVRVDGKGVEMERWPMVSKKSGGYQRRLHSLRNPFTFYLQGSTGRTHRYTITPKPKAKPKVGKDQRPAPDPKNQVASTSINKPGVGGSDPNSAQLRQILANLQALIDASARLRSGAQSMSDRLNDLPDQEPMPQWMIDRLDQLVKDLKRFEGRNQLTADQLRDLAKAVASDDAQLAQMLEKIADLMLQLQMVKMAKTAKPAGQSQGTGTGKGAKPWIQQLADAAAQDQLKIHALSRRLGEAAGGTLSRNSAAEARPLKTPDTQGDYYERTAKVSDGNWKVPDAVMRQVPPSYRNLVDRYYRRLRKDEQRKK